ncbi:MAG: GMC family oxidoreductase [Endozoicomonas sp.]
MFEKRPGFPGWPITKADLDPYYADAVGFNHLYGDYGCDGLNFTAVFFAAEMQKQGIDARVPRIENFNPEMYQFMGKQWLNFATRTFENGTTISDSSARVIVNASVLNIVEQNGSVQYLNVASMNDDMSNPQKDTEFTVTADIYLLACGAVANARQLLLSGIGNSLVGRYFMCHPLSRGNIIQTTSTYMTPAEHNLMNGTDWTDPTGNGVNITGRFIADENIAKEHEIGRCWFWARNQYQSSQMFFEMTPNYDSFISLNDTTDPVFGQQQTHIHWELNDNDQKTYETNCNLFNQAISQHSGSISWPGWEEARSQWTVNGHHIGTTRMSASHRPDEGVVDQNLKIHGIDNMYVAGSSVFPSAGISNPTMTIIALSLRLAGKIHSEL